MPFPNFFVIGAGRCGTTSLHNYLGQHPQVFVCRQKSPNYFVAGDPAPAREQPVARAMMRHWVTDRERYLSLFDEASNELAIGEVSPVYLQSANAPERIRSFCPEARHIAVLRQPVDRAYAHFLGRQRDGIEPPGSFSDRVSEELAAGLPDRVAFGSYLACGRYHHFLRGYFDRFPASHIRVYLLEDMGTDLDRLLRDLFGFLGVDPEFTPDTTARLNRSGTIRNPLLRALWTRSVKQRIAARPHLPSALRRAAGAPFLRDLDVPDLEPELARRLLDVFRDDIRRLEDLLQRDLSAWLET